MIWTKKNHIYFTDSVTHRKVTSIKYMHPMYNEMSFSYNPLHTHTHTHTQTPDGIKFKQKKKNKFKATGIKYRILL